MTAQISPFGGRTKTTALDASLTAIRDDILASVRADHDKHMRAMENTIERLNAQVQSLLARKIEIAAPPAPNVSVSPHIDVKTPATIPPDVNVEVDFKALTSVLDKVLAQLVLANKPTVRTVSRDSHGTITEITDRKA